MFGSAEGIEEFVLIAGRYESYSSRPHPVVCRDYRKSQVQGFTYSNRVTVVQACPQEDICKGHCAQRFVVSWEISSQWKPDARVELASEVEVRFVAEAPGRTRVVLEHRNFERMGLDAGESMRKGVDGGWPALLELFARAAAQGGRS